MCLLRVVQDWIRFRQGLSISRAPHAATLVLPPRSTRAQIIPAGANRALWLPLCERFSSVASTIIQKDLRRDLIVMCEHAFFRALGSLVNPVRFYSHATPKMSGRTHYPIHQCTPGWTAKSALLGFLYYHPFVPAFGINENADFVRSHIFG